MLPTRAEGEAAGLLAGVGPPVAAGPGMAQQARNVVVLRQVHAGAAEQPVGGWGTDRQAAASATVAVSRPSP